MSTEELVVCDFVVKIRVQKTIFNLKSKQVFCVFQCFSVLLTEELLTHAQKEVTFQPIEFLASNDEKESIFNVEYFIEYLFLHSILPILVNWICLSVSEVQWKDDWFELFYNSFLLIKKCD